MGNAISIDKSAKCKTQNAKCKTQSAKRKTQSAKRCHSERTRGIRSPRERILRLRCAPLRMTGFSIASCRAHGYSRHRGYRQCGGAEPLPYRDDRWGEQGTGIDMHFLPVAENYGSNQCLHWLQQHATGMLRTDCSIPVPSKKGHPRWGCPFLEQGTGIEPAFTAWEAVVLPIYEPCMAPLYQLPLKKASTF